MINYDKKEMIRPKKITSTLKIKDSEFLVSEVKDLMIFHGQKTGFYIAVVTESFRQSGKGGILFHYKTKKERDEDFLPAFDIYMKHLTEKYEPKTELPETSLEPGE